MKQKLEIIKQNVIECTKCDLSKTRTNSVPGKGNFHSNVIFVGEALEKTKTKMVNHLSVLQEKNFQLH